MTINTELSQVRRARCAPRERRDAGAAAAAHPGERGGQALRPRQRLPGVPSDRQRRRRRQRGLLECGKRLRRQSGT